MMPPRAFTLEDFMRESNRIEGIHRDPTKDEIEATEKFASLLTLSVNDVVALVGVYQPNARLRDKPGLNVRVGQHFPPSGGPHIAVALEHILEDASGVQIADPWAVHCCYETLHPFTDGNGRSGRALWLWQMRRNGSKAPLGFLHHFYYQTLSRRNETSPASPHP